MSPFARVFLEVDGPADGSANPTAAPIEISPAGGFTSFFDSSSRTTWPHGEPVYRESSNCKLIANLPAVLFRC
jgi:hypothetical protein